MGACIVRGLNNWSRIHVRRDEWERENAGESATDDGWAEEFQQLIPHKGAVSGPVHHSQSRTVQRHCRARRRPRRSGVARPIAGDSPRARAHALLHLSCVQFDSQQRLRRTDRGLRGSGARIRRLPLRLRAALPRARGVSGIPRRRPARGLPRQAAVVGRCVGRCARTLAVQSARNLEGFANDPSAAPAIAGARLAG